MKSVTNAEFLASLQNGDIGLILAKNLFATVQALYAHRFSEGAGRASHGFFMKTPPNISEANGIVISQGNSTILKNIGDKTKCWLFRYTKLTHDQLCAMNSYAAGAEETGGHYSVGGIFQFAKSFITGRRDTKDESGVFCTEYTSRIIRAAGIDDYIKNRKVWEIDPSTQLNWFLERGPMCGWILAAYYDGTNYFIDDAGTQSKAA